MKIIKIALILLVPAMGIVGCKKSGVKPNCPSQQNSQVSSQTNSEPLNIIGSGDDDRDGGDKKNRKSLPK